MGGDGNAVVAWRGGDVLVLVGSARAVQCDAEWERAVLGVWHYGQPDWRLYLSTAMDYLASSAIGFGQNCVQAKPVGNPA